MRIINFQLVEISLSIFHKAVASVVPSPSWMSILFTDSIVSSISLQLLQLVIGYVAQIKIYSIATRSIFLQLNCFYRDHRSLKSLSIWSNRNPGPRESHLFLGHLKMLVQETVPKFSPSCSVLGRCLQRVSGRKRAAIPPRQEKVPMITSGSILLIVP